MKATPPPTDNPTSNQFEDMLRRHRKGVASDKASRMLAQALQASRDTGAKSKVMLEVTLLPGTDDQMRIDIQVKSKLPDEKLPGGLFWLDDENRLHTSDPKQPELPLREVAREAGPQIRDTKSA